jgi:hypothetical protein
MRPDRIVMAPPAIDEHLSLVECREFLAFEQLVSELGVEALAIAVLPWRSRLDVKRLDAEPGEQGPQIPGDELGANVRTHVLGLAMPAHKVCPTVEDVVRSETSRNHDRQAAPRELVNVGQHPTRSFVLGRVLHEVIAPDMVGPLRSETNA